jgi:adenine-specific DNA methylase
LIETWLPIAELGIESVRERTPMTPFPAPNRLHVWWARRPLVASRAAVLASLLPGDADQARFLRVLGIHGDPVASRKRINAARQRGTRFEGEAYSYPRAFSYSPSEDELVWVAEQMSRLGLEKPTVLDPTAGGGSIPFEAVRLRLPTFANDLNPVAVLIERLTIQSPLTFGNSIVPEFRRLADHFLALREERLKDFFPSEPESNSIPTNFIWARTITCLYCDGLIPLSPNWRLAPDGTGVKLHPNPTTKRCTFEIVSSVKQQSEGTVKGGDATCPYCQRNVDGDKIKEQRKPVKWANSFLRWSTSAAL